MKQAETYEKLRLLPSGSVTARGWLRDQLLRCKDGLGGHLHELEPAVIGTPYHKPCIAMRPMPAKPMRYIKHP